jgi:hypothetical protein
MKNIYYLLSLLLSSTILNATQADELYQSLISKSLFTSNNLTLQSGWYKFDKTDGDRVKLSNSNFVGSYFFGQKGDYYRPYIQGGFGFSKITQDNTNLNRNGSLDDIEFDSTYLKIGAGCNFNPYKDISFVVGASAMWMESDDGNFNPEIPLSDSDYDKRVAQLFDTKSNSQIYDIFSAVVYHPNINGYDTHFDATLHYIDMEFDHDIENIDGFNLDLNARFHTQEVARVLDLPIWLEFFTSATFVDSDLSDVVDFDEALTVGTSIHWKIGPMITIFDNAFKDVDLRANLQGTISNRDFQGWKVSLSLSILKF